MATTTARRNPLTGLSEYDRDRLQRDPFMQLAPGALQGLSQDDVPYTAAERFAAARKLQSKQLTPGAFPGANTAPPGWQSFADFHGLQDQLASGRGNQYRVALPTVSSLGDTFGTKSGGSMSGAAQRVTSGGDASDPEFRNLALAALEEELTGKKLANRKLQDEIDRTGHAYNDSLDFGASGLPLLEERKQRAALMALADQNDEAASDYWRNEEPISVHKMDLAEKQAQLGQGRALELANAKGEAAAIDDRIRAGASAGRDTSNQAIAALKAMAGRAGNAEQYGNIGRRDQMDAAMDAQTGRMIGASAVQGPDFPGKSVGEKQRNPDTGMVWQWDGQKWSPLGGR